MSLYFGEYNGLFFTGELQDKEVNIMNFQTFHFKLNIIQLQSNEQMNVNINNKPSAFTQLTVIL